MNGHAKHLTNLPIYDGCLSTYGSADEVVAFREKAGLDGVEVIWDFEPCLDYAPSPDLVVGHHLLFWASWVDYWKGDRQALLEQFGDWDTVKEYYLGETRDDMIEHYRRDLQRAIDYQAEYVVFHVSEVSLEECFTYRFKFSDQEVIDAAAELINGILDNTKFEGAFLVENQWWPGFKFTDPALTRRLMDSIEYDNKGIMLDVGHLMSTNTALRTQAEAARYICECFDAHEGLGEYVRGMHLHKSLSGSYVEQSGFRVPDDLGDTFFERFANCYGHILRIDRHEPWDDPAVGPMLAHLNPEWVVHELSAWPLTAHAEAIRTQMRALGRSAEGFK